MGKYTLLIVLAAVLGGTFLTTSLRSSLDASDAVHVDGQEAVLAREIARSAQSLALSRMVGTGGFQDPGFTPASEFEGGEFDVELAPGWTPEMATLIVRGRYGGAVHEVQSTYRYDPMDAPGPLWLDVPYATGENTGATVSGGGRPVYFDRRKHDDLRLGSFLPLDGITSAATPGTLADAIAGAGNGFETPAVDAWAGGLLEDLNVDDTEGLYQATEAAFDDARDRRLAGDQTITGSVTWGDIDAITIIDGDLTIEGAVRGEGALVVKGDLVVPASGRLEWTGLVVVRSTADVLTLDLDGIVDIDGAVAVTHQALPPGGHLDVSVYRDPTGMASTRPQGTGTLWTWTTRPWYQHTHAFDRTPDTAPRGARVYYLEGGAAGRHEDRTQFYDLLRQLGTESVYLEFGNAHNHGFSRVTLDVTGTDGTGGPLVATARTGFPGTFAHPGSPLRSPTFAANALRHLDVDVRSLRALRQAFDDPSCSDWPVCIGQAWDREGALAVRLMRADGTRLYESTLYWHKRTDEEAAHAAEEQAWRDRIQAGEAFGTRLNLGDRVDITYARTPLVDLAPTLGFDGDEVTLIETASNHGPATDPAGTVVCHKPGTPAEATRTFSGAALTAHLGHGDTLGACP